MSFTASDHLLTINEIHEKYLFRKKLGQGGFCDVFLAENRKSGEKVAVKMMEMDSSGEKIDRRVARFRREMMLYSQLDHINVVKVLDSGETDTGLLFIIFEYIKGCNLAQLLKKEGALSISRTIDLMVQLLRGLDEAHTRCIIHRDLKPENIMVAAVDGVEQVKILDFGISTFISGQCSDSQRITATRDFLGTPLYAAPEQLRGEPVSFKSDIYAWGLLFLECITGKSPFSGQTVAAVVQQQLTKAPVPLPAALVNHRLGMLLRWVLEKDAIRRAGNIPVILSHLESITTEGIVHENGYIIVDESDCEPGSVQNIMIYKTAVSQQERRQVTAVCCMLDLQPIHNSDSPEILDEIYQDLMNLGRDVAAEYGAHVVNDSGDRVLAFFGYPDASDTDAGRAARSVLELANLFTRRKMVFSIQHGIKFSFRMGVHTGMVTVRRNAGSKTQLSGLMLNHTGRLCAAADPDSINLSQSSYLLLKNSVECREVDRKKTAESFPDDSVYRLIGERGMESVWDKITVSRSPMVGRDGELAMLQDAWKTLDNSGSGKVILLHGEAGIGKSRLAAEFAKNTAKNNCGWMECLCLPEGKNSALHPILGLLRNKLGLLGDTSPESKSCALEQNLRLYGIDCSLGMPLFCSWFGLPSDGYEMPQISPQKQKESMLQMSSEIIAGIAKKSEAVIMIEDLHWADPTTLEMLPKLFEQVKKRGVMLIMSARPVFVPSWNSTEAEVLTVNPLENEDVEIIIRNIFGSINAGQYMVEKIINRVDGVPLFAEEITRLICDNGADKEEIPATLRDLLTGKIDQLGPARETAQIASVIGREFDYKLIEKVSLKDAASLLADLDQLISAGLMHVQLIVGNPHYAFHHALVRDAACESIGQLMREDMHCRIAEVLEMEADCKPEVLAWHWAKAAEFEKATTYGIKAACGYLMRSLYLESIHHATECLEWVNKIQNEKSEIDKELQVLQLLIPAYISTKGFAAPELEKINLRTDELQKKLPEDSEFLTSILWGKVIYYETTPDYQKMEKYLGEALLKGNKYNNNDLLAALYSVKSHFNCSHGLFKESIRDADVSIKHYENKKLLNHGTVFGHDSKVLSLGVQALSLAINGDIYSAGICMDQSIRFASSINDPSSKGLAYAYQLCMLNIRNEKKMIGKYCIEFREFIKRYGLELWTNVVELQYSWATGDVEKAKQCLQVFKIIGLGQLAPYWNFIAAQTEYDCGLFTDSLDRIKGNIEKSYETGEIYYLPELYRLKALCHAEIDPQNTGVIEENLNYAVDTAEKNDARLFKLRALIDYSRIIKNPIMREKNMVQIDKTVESFMNFPMYQEYNEIMEAAKIKLTNK